MFKNVSCRSGFFHKTIVNNIHQIPVKFPHSFLRSVVPQTQKQTVPDTFLFIGVRAFVSMEPVYLLCCPVTFLYVVRDWSYRQSSHFSNYF